MKKCNLDGNLLDAVAMASEILGHDIGENVVLVVDSADADETGDETSAFEDELEEDQKAIAEFYASSDDDEVEEDDTGDDVMYIIVTRKSRRANTRASKAREKRAVAKNARIASLNTKSVRRKTSKTIRMVRIRVYLWCTSSKSGLKRSLEQRNISKLHSNP